MNLLLLIAAVIALVWGMNLALRISPLMSCALYLVMAGAIGYEFFHFDVAGINLSLDRLVLLGTVGSYFLNKKLGRTSPKAVEPADFALFAFFALLVGNIFAFGTSSPDPNQVPIIQHMIEGYVIPLFLFWIARHAIINQRAVNRLFCLFALFGIYLAFTALFEIAGFWSLVFPKIIANPDVGIHFGRARGPFLQSVRLGVYLFAGLAAVWIALVWRGVWGRHGRMLGLCLTPLFLAALLTTLTRSAWVGTALATLILFTLTLSGLPRRAVILGMVAAGIVVGAVVHKGFFSLEREYGAAETRQSTDMRVVFAYVSWLMVKEQPLQGMGFGHFPYKKDQYLNDRQTTLQMESVRGYIHHNTFLSILVELGLIGFTLYVAVLASWFCRAWALWNDSGAPDWMRGQGLLLILFMSFYLVQMMFHEVTYSALENGLLFFLAGLTSGLVSMRGLHRSTEFQIQIPAVARPAPFSGAR